MEKKLSDLIFNGAKKSPAVERGWYGKTADGKMSTCAIMGAAEECGLVTQDEKGNPVFSAELERAWGAIDRLTGEVIPTSRVVWPDWLRRLLDVRVESPCDCKKPTGGHPTVFNNVIQHLHDFHKWSREATAMWVEREEKDLERRQSAKCPGWGGVAPTPVEVRDTVKVEA